MRKMECRKRAYPSLEIIGHPIELYLNWMARRREQVSKSYGSRLVK